MQYPEMTFELLPYAHYMRTIAKMEEPPFWRLMTTTNAERLAEDRRRSHAQAPPWITADPASSPATSNQGWDEVPFQRWYRFKEAFSPRLVLDAIESTRSDVRTCCDPFGGGGTTSLVCQYLGIEPTTIEVNPFLADLIRAKLTSYDPHQLIETRSQIAFDVHRRVGDCHIHRERLFPGAPPTMVEPGLKGRWIFDEAVGRRICHYRDAIDAIGDESIRRLFRVLLGSTLLGVSNVLVNGKGRRYRRPSRRHQSGPDDLDAAFTAAFERALFDVCRYENRLCRTFTLLQGDARDLAAEIGTFDLALFSPPYPNSFDYTDIYNVELWALGYLGGTDDNRRLREATLRSHVQIHRDYAAGSVIEESESLRRTLARLDDVRATLWNRNIPAMIGAYFADLGQVLAGLRRSVAASGQLMMVVGNSRYAGVVVDVPRIVAEIAPSIGLTCESIKPVRAMRASAQQGGDLALSESLLVLFPT